MVFDGFEHDRAEVNGLTISYAAGGSGPPVLLLHGFPQTKAMWSPVAAVLQEHYTVVCPDLRGYGDSAAPSAAEPEQYSFRAMGADAAALMSQLGFERFHLIGHDRGARAAHRLALDMPQKVRSLAVLDIVPTDTMLDRVTRDVAHVYWHWYFLSQAPPLPERLIQHDPDFFFETCLTTWGATEIEAFAPELLGEYRRCWRDPKMISAACCDYRAAVGIDHRLDRADIGHKVACPTLAFWGAAGVISRLFDIGAEWHRKCEAVQTAELPGGHFFVDQFPRQTAEILGDWLDRQT